jgi:phytoene synthase
MTLERAYRHCRRRTRRAASSFYHGMRLLPREKRWAVFAIYAWTRTCDDAVDELEGAEAESALEAARDLLRRAAGDGFAADPDPVAVALGDAMRRFRLPPEPFEALLAGMEMDLRVSRYENFEQLRLYCERAAGAVGRACVAVFGYRDPAAPALAVDMGVALQLTNILRDLAEDARRGRVYLPRDEMVRAGYSAEDLLAGRRTPGFERLMAQQVARARAYYQRSERLFALVEPDARPCLVVLHGVYRALLERISASGYDVLSRRVVLPTVHRLGLVSRALWEQRWPRRRGA